MYIIGRAQNRMGDGELEIIFFEIQIMAINFFLINVAQGFYDSYFRKCTSKGCHPKLIGKTPFASLFSTHAPSPLSLSPFCSNGLQQYVLQRHSLHR